MEKYKVVSPANEQELSRILRTNKLTGLVLDLTVLRELDELSIRRGEVPEPTTIGFQLEEIHLNRPAFLFGMAMAGDDIIGPARIDVVGDNEDEESNDLELLISPIDQ